jgi:putative DNA primase/helicase
VFGNDAEGREALQEWMGYNLVADNSHQKIFLVVGPKRAGKGTIARVLTALVGQSAMGSISLSTLSQQFGLQQLIGKQCCIMPDVRFGGRSDASAVVERLLSISGGDRVAIERKYLSTWVDQLSTRFTIMTNELPQLPDSAGALLERLIIVELKRSFAGAEDVGLSDKLMQELPGILSWTLDGYRRLAQRGRFQQPRSASGSIDLMSALSSPVKAFVEERCRLGPGLTVSKDAMFREWRHHCEAANMPAGTKERFGRDFKLAFPQTGETRPSTGIGRVRKYTGITLNSEEFTLAAREKVVQLRRGEE